MFVNPGHFQARPVLLRIFLLRSLVCIILRDRSRSVSFLRDSSRVTRRARNRATIVTRSDAIAKDARDPRYVDPRRGRLQPA